MGVPNFLIPEDFHVFVAAHTEIESLFSVVPGEIPDTS